MLTATRPVAVRQHERVSAISTDQLSKRYGDTLALDRLDLTPFQHVAPVPSQPFRTGAAVALVVIAAAAALAALRIFDRRDLTGA